MNLEILQTVNVKMSQPYKRLDFAILKTNGLGFVFDTLRYERAFLLRQGDIDLLKIAVSSLEIFHRPAELLLGRYSWVQKPWTVGRLLSDQRLNELTSDEVFRLTGRAIEKKPKSALKIESRAEVEGHLPLILELMFNNGAMPATEGDSGILEQAFYSSDQSKIKVTLMNFVAVEGKWKI